MMKEFEMIDLGLMRYFLGIKIVQSDKGIFICQTKYAKDVLRRFNMMNFNPAPTLVLTGTKLSKNDFGPYVDSTLFKKLVGSLMYLIATRLDIVYGVSLISRLMKSPKDSHWKVGKRKFRYVARAKEYEIFITKLMSFL